MSFVHLLPVKVWTVVDLLREVDTSLRYEVDRILCDRIMSHIMKLNSICSDSMGVLHTKIHPVKSVHEAVLIIIEVA